MSADATAESFSFLTDAMFEDAATLEAELRDLAERVPPHWNGYILTRLEVDTGDAEKLERCRNWVRKYATVDDVIPPDSVLATTDKGEG